MNTHAPLATTRPPDMGGCASSSHTALLPPALRRATTLRFLCHNAVTDTRLDYSNRAVEGVFTYGTLPRCTNRRYASRTCRGWVGPVSPAAAMTARADQSKVNTRKPWCEGEDGRGTAVGSRRVATQPVGPFAVTHGAQHLDVIHNISDIPTGYNARHHHPADVK